MLPTHPPALSRVVLATLLLAALIGLPTVLASPPTQAQSIAQTTTTPSVAATQTATATPTIASATRTVTPTATVQYPLYFPWLVHIAPGYPTAPFLWTEQPSWNSVTLRWRGGASLYFLLQSSHPDMSEAQTVYTGSDTQLTITLPVGTYYFQVQAANSWGATPSNRVTVEVVPPPPTPTPSLTPTPSPTPDPNLLFLCNSGGSFGRNYLAERGCYDIRGITRPIQPNPVSFEATLLRDIVGRTYTFDLYLDAFGTETVEVSLIHAKGDSRETLAQFRTDISGSQSGDERYRCLDFGRTPIHVVQTVSGRDPNVTPNESRLIFEFRSLSNSNACIRYGSGEGFASKFRVPGIANTMLLAPFSLRAPVIGAGEGISIQVEDGAGE